MQASYASIIAIARGLIVSEQNYTIISSPYQPHNCRRGNKIHG